MASPREKETFEDQRDDRPQPSPGLSTSDLELASSGVNEGALLRKLDLRLLPPVIILYLLSFLDRSNGMLDAMTENRQIFVLTDPSRKCSN